jgi:hypothetical protein
MAQRKSGPDTSVWLGMASPQHEAFAGGEMWVGRHSGDQDILVFDPAQADATADPISLYSLSQHRIRSFPRATVVQKIQPLTDELGRARAIKEYGQRADLLAAHEAGLAEESTTRQDRRRESVLAAHKRYIEGLGLEYQGAHETAANHKSGRRTKCHVCGIGLDDFAGAVCGICDGVLCSCGGCACGIVKGQR